jgi:biopolymer transport protein TolR
MQSRAKSDINITPLIDIVLVLLIVFIVMVPSLAKTLDVSVPRVTTDPPKKGDDIPLVLSLDKDGRLFLQREEVPLVSLPDHLVPAVMLQPLRYRKVYLKVDGDLPQERAVRVLDQIRVASDRACRETKARPGFEKEDGGPIKVAITLLKGNRPA